MRAREHASELGTVALGIARGLGAAALGLALFGSLAPRAAADQPGAEQPAEREPIVVPQATPAAEVSTAPYEYPPGAPPELYLRRQPSLLWQASDVLLVRPVQAASLVPGALLAVFRLPFLAIARDPGDDANALEEHGEDVVDRPIGEF
jgi:hypothetical protein